MKLKQLGYGLSAVALAASILPMGNVFAENEATVVSSYSELVTALGDTNISEIKLGADITAAFVGTVKPGDVYRLMADHDVTIDTNGFTLKDNADKECRTDADAAIACNMLYVGKDVNVTVKGNGAITATRNIVSVDGGTFTLDGVDLTSTTDYGIYGLNDGSVYVKSGSISAKNAALSGNNTTGNMNFYVSGGTLNADGKPTIYMPGQTNLQVSGDAVLNGGLVVRMGQIKISGGTINTAASKIDEPGDAKCDNNGNICLDVGGFVWLPGAVNVMGGYTSKDALGNSLNLEISGGTFVSKNDSTYGHLVGVYDNEWLTEAQDVNIKITGGDASGIAVEPVKIYRRKDITDTVKKEGAAQMDVSVEISGGVFKDALAEEYVKDGFETEIKDGKQVVVSVTTDLSGVKGVSTPELGDEKSISGAVKFFDEIVADRKATLSVEKIDAGKLTVDAEKAGELVLAFDINLLDRDGGKIEVIDNDVIVYLELTKEQYEALAEYDSVKVVYFESGEEKERLDAAIYDEDDDVYTLVFRTTHFSSYGVAGVNDPEEPVVDDSAAETPDTGAFTAEAGSKVAGAVAVAVMVAIITMAGVAIKFNKR